MAKHIWVVPSNQLKNVVYGDPNPAPGITTEEQIAVIRTKAAFDDACRSGWTPHWTYIPGAGDSSVDELVRALDRMMTEIRKLGLMKEAHVLSYHSDASGHQDIYPLTCRDSTLEKVCGRSSSCCASVRVCGWTS